MRNLAGTVLGGAAAGALPSALLELVGDVGTLVPGRLDRPCWRVMRPLTSPTVRPLAATSARGVRELVAVNDGLCPRGGALERPVTIPEGVATVRLVLEEVSIQSGVGSSEPLTIEIRDATGATVMASASHTPSGTSTDVATTAVAVTSGTEYIVRICCNETGQSRFVCNKIRLEPVAIADARWRNFLRIDVAEEVLQDSVETGHQSPRFMRQNQFAHIDLLTDADSIVVEAYDNVNDYLTNRGRFGVFVDGYPLDPVETTAGQMNFAAVDLPSVGRRIRHVSVWAGPQAVSGLPAPATDNRGTFICAIYVPRSAYVDVLPEPRAGAGRVVSMLVDSKGSGFYSENPGVDSLVPMLRRSGVRVVSVGAGGSALYHYTGATLTVAACTPLARTLLRKRPDEVIIQIGRNDFAAGLFSGANLVTQLGNLCDAIHAVDPRVQVTLVTFTREVTENSVGGVSWDTVRTNTRALATSRSDWCRVRDAGEYWSPSDVSTYTSSDTVHLSGEGQAKSVQGIIGISHPWSPLQISSLWCWAEAYHRMPGGAAGAITSSGSSPPTITVSGTATYACRVRIEIKTGGVRGVARFRWGIDDLGWVEQNVPTSSAPVPLTGIGLWITFPSGSYANNVVYTFVTQVAAMLDLSGNGRAPTGLPAQFPDYAPVAIGGKPGLLFTPTEAMRLNNISVPAPYTLCAVGQLEGARVQAIVGRTVNGSGALLYSNASGTAMSFNDGANQITATCDAFAANCYIARVNGASSSVRVNGTATTGTLANTTLTGFLVGADGVSGFGWDKWIKRVVIFSEAISDAQCRAIEAWCRADLGTA